MRGKQSVKKGIWHIGSKYKRAPKGRQKGVQFHQDFYHQLEHHS